jgi:rubredoxin|tara:strand:- start:957 stop:1154 length:198 start_codon:yes stop_codon:yes gene_type:complete
MSDEQQLDNSVKFRPDYQWPDKDAQRNCPKCNDPMQRQENVSEYYGKPWWCHTCQWQFSEEELND